MGITATDMLTCTQHVRDTHLRSWVGQVSKPDQLQCWPVLAEHAGKLQIMLICSYNVEGTVQYVQIAFSSQILHNWTGSGVL